MTPQQLKALRARLGLTQEALAQQMGVARNSVNRWEMGLRAISPMAVKLLRTIRLPAAQ